LHIQDTVFPAAEVAADPGSDPVESNVLGPKFGCLSNRPTAGITSWFSGFEFGALFTSYSMCLGAYEAIFRRWPRSRISDGATDRWELYLTRPHQLQAMFDICWSNGPLHWNHRQMGAVSY
jgi:hypothetical protein